MNDRSETHCGVVGLGYVGLTLAINFDEGGYEVIGYDIDEEKIEELQRGHDVTGNYSDAAIRGSDTSFTNSPGHLERCDYVFLSLPTPVDGSGTPDLSGLEAASETVGRYISDGTIVVVESTVYPGTTREVVKPAVERGTAEQGGVTFSIGYSPERIVPGGGRRFSEALKIVSAEDESTRRDLAELYGSVVDAGVHQTATMEAAEASKCLENVQRDANIALINEFAMGCRHLDFELDPYEVLEAARTKWNFHDYKPGVVGGHCIPVDPHYLRYKFEESGYYPDLLRTARSVNQRMLRYVSSITVTALTKARADGRVLVEQTEGGVDIPSEGSLPENAKGANVLLLGFGYKPNVADVRNSGVNEIANQLQSRGLRVSGYDPYFDRESAPDSYNFEVLSRLEFEGFDAAVLLTPHNELRELNLDAVSRRMNDDPVLVDTGMVFDRAEAEDQGFTYTRL